VAHRLNVGRLLRRVVLMMFLCAPQAYAAPTLAFDATQGAVALAPNLEFHADRDGTANAAAMFALADTGEFRPLPNGSATFGFVDGAYWLHARVVSTDPAAARRLLVVEYALLDHVDIYLRRDDGSVSHRRSGDAVPFGERDLSYRHPNFWVDLEPGRPLDILVRAQSASSMQVPLHLYTAGAFVEKSRDAQLAIGLYYGILLALLFYNFILFISLRDRSHCYYSLHVAGFGLVQFCLNGFAFEYLWPNSPWLANAAVPMSMALAMLAMHLFAREFLELPRRWRAGSRLLGALIAFHAVMAVAAAFLPYRTAVLIGTAAVFPGVAAIIVCAAVAAARGFRPAVLFLFAWAMLLAGTAVYALVSFGVVPKTFATEYGMQIGSAAEMIFLSFALAYRWAALRDENERIAREANERLEHRVDERTRELSDALQQLGEAHARLREVSARDGLTGVYNRRHVDAVFATTLAHCLADARPFSLLVADLDHFKRVNDEHGHLAGDDCLRTVAATLGASVGERALVARFGGEEFLVLMPGVDELAARRTAENVRQRIAAQTIVVDGGATLRLTVSIGIATVPGTVVVTPEALLRRADEALYEAKRAGRNRVVQGTVAA
jgi:diguanylate cyclase (GGDEF)-like protein